MQETDLTSKSQQEVRAQWRGDVTFSHSTSSARGLCIAFRPNLEKNIFSPPICDENIHFIIVYVEIQGVTLCADKLLCSKYRVCSS